ncbi:MAG: hypothetical protein ABFD03_09870, partial [Clostridiaceae bacterium]
MSVKQTKSHSPARNALAKSTLITSVYALFGITWIVVTDLFVANRFGESLEAYLASIAKGLLFVLLTSALIFILVYLGFLRILRDGESRDQSENALREAQRLAHIGSFSFDIT